MPNNKVEIYNIIEVANTHGGDINYIKDLIQEFSEFKEGFGIKFQPISADTLATPDFEWYPVYKEIYFTPSEWEEIISQAFKSKDVWIDLFDSYGYKILSNNFSKISGVKFQSSVLYNLDLFESLKNLDFSNKKVILNIAARSIEEIKEVIKQAENDIKPAEIILEIGFQAYPTAVEDNGLNKIKKLRDNFDNKLVFADHVDANTDDAIWLPVLAACKGIDYIEKHVRLNRETKFDYFSSLTLPDFKSMISKVELYNKALGQDFINVKEENYLTNTLMVPLLKNSKSSSELISLKRDLLFRRSAKRGLSLKEIRSYIKSFYVLSTDKKQNESFKIGEFKKANIGTIIACRLKSTRLPKKALLKIGNKTSVEKCISSCLKFENINHTILATSNLESDQELENYTFSPSVIFHQGDPIDVIQRYIDICDELRLDVVVRVTADMPYVDNEICQTLLKNHFEEGADYTTATDAIVGTNLEIFNVKALKKIKKHFPYAEFSEYMTWYFQNNPEVFKINKINLNEDLIRPYRLTLDYQEDLDLFNAISEYFGESEYSLREVINFLDKNPEIAELNISKTLAYKTDQELIDKLNEHTKI